MNPVFLLFVAALGLFALFESQDASASPVSSGDGSSDNSDASTPTSDLTFSDPTVDTTSSSSDPFSTPDSVQAASSASANVTAFLAALRQSEGTAQHANPYAVLFGGGDGSSYGTSDHPANLGWKGVPYTDKSGKKWISTAAGAYQFIVGTWNGLEMPDFTPASQDAAAVQLIRNAGQYDAVANGDFQTAIAGLGNVWASLPSSTAAQPTVALASFLSFIQNAGGSVVS